MTRFVKVGVVGDFEEGLLYDRQVGKHRIAVVRTNDRFYAVSSVCTHYGYSITPGRASGGSVTCPVHGAAFNLEDGEPTDGPAAGPLDIFAVRLEGEDVLVAESPGAGA